jgi:hypothetical protein
MAPRKSKTLAKEHVCSDPFIVDDDESVEGSDDDDYEELVLLFIFIKCSVLTSFLFSGESIGDDSDESVEEEALVLSRISSGY